MARSRCHTQFFVFSVINENVCICKTKNKLETVKRRAPHTSIQFANRINVSNRVRMTIDCSDFRATRELCASTGHFFANVWIQTNRIGVFMFMNL